MNYLNSQSFVWMGFQWSDRNFSAFIKKSLQKFKRFCIICALKIRVSDYRIFFFFWWTITLKTSSASIAVNQCCIKEETKIKSLLLIINAIIKIRMNFSTNKSTSDLIDFKTTRKTSTGGRTEPFHGYLPRGHNQFCWRWHSKVT